MNVIPMRKARRHLRRLLLEELESRVCPTAVCNVNPTYEAECVYLDNLIPSSAITLTAVQSGIWSNPATWGGRLPGNGDNVWIPKGITVTVDSQEPGALRSILDNGVLTFAPNVNTSLTVNTVVVGTDNNPTGLPQGELDIGTAANPIQSGVTTKLIFADLGPQSSLFPNDRNQLSGGLISMGTLNIYGSQVTPWVNMQNAAAGATTLTLASQPTGWKAGDTLLLPGTSPTANQDEQIQIVGIVNNADGTAIVTLAAPLHYTHAAPAGQTIQVADENRSVIIGSQDTTNQDGAAGQVMQMHNDAASVQYAALLNLGRTNKAVQLNNAQFDATGNLVPGTGTNQVGRYALHFHRDYYPGVTNNDPPIQAVGNFEMGSPGWGYVNHSSNVAFVDNVAYANFGAAFVTEAGNELGRFDSNLAIRSIGVPNGANTFTARFNAQDFGQGGEGFWLTSPGTPVTNNIATDCQVGYGIFSFGLGQDGLGTTGFWTSPTNPRQVATLSSVPLVTFSGDTASNVAQGLQMWNQAALTGVTKTLLNFTAWGVTQQGINLAFADSNVTLQNDTLLAAPGSSATYGVKLNESYDSRINMNGLDVEGFQIGANLPLQFVAGVNGGYWDNQTNFLIDWVDGPRQILFTGTIAFGPHSQLDYHLVEPAPSPYVYLYNNASEPNPLFGSDQILLPNGQQLYYTIQAANYVPFPTASPLVSQFVGLTNAQLLQQFGMVPGGVLASADATASPLTDGLLGSAVAEPATPVYTSPMIGWIGSPYTLTYTLNTPTSVGTTVYTVPSVVLQNPWNVITATVNGAPYSWVVAGRAFSNNNLPLPAAIVGTAYNQSVQVPPGYTMSFTVTSGTLPAWLTLTTNGRTLTIAGTPTVTGSITLQLTGTDPNGNTVTESLLVTVNPEDVSAQVSWTSSPLTFDPSTRLYSSVITLTNNGPTDLTGILEVVLSGLPNGPTTLANANGTYKGNPYILVPLPSGNLAAGQSVSFMVQFRFPVRTFTLTTYEQSL